MDDSIASMPPPASANGAGTGGVIHLTWPPSLPVSSVLERARTFDKAAIGMLYQRFLPVVYRFVLARVADPSHAEDVTADTFFAMMEGIPRARANDELTFAAWLLGIARHKVALHFRHLRGQPESYADGHDELEPLATAEEDDPLTILTARERWTEVVRALNQLTEEQRNVVLYKCVLGYSTEEVARMLEKQPGTIRALQFRALASLSRHLGISREIAPSGQDTQPLQPGGRWDHASRG